MTESSKAEKEAKKLVNSQFYKSPDWVEKYVASALSKRDQRIEELEATVERFGKILSKATLEENNSRITELETELRELRKGGGE